ncbi:MAG: hypothetical protein V8S74_02615 [Lachnospirales bacterium]
MRYINELTDGERIVDFYFCKQRQSMKSQKTGKNYLSLVLSDKTGTINGKVWIFQGIYSHLMKVTTLK